MWGGGSNAFLFTGTWSLLLGPNPEWRLLSPLGFRPPWRHSGGGVYDPVGDRMVMFGGDFSEYRNDTWFLDWSVVPVRETPEVFRIPEAVEALNWEDLDLVMPLPNPSSELVSIRFALRAQGRARIEVFEASGRRIRILVDESLPRGQHEVSWDGRDDRGRSVPTGVYLVRLQAADHAVTRKLVRIPH